jgi:hypothetical protein
MKNFIRLLFLLVTVSVFTACSNSAPKLGAVLPESPSAVAARTLGLPADYAPYHDYWVTGSEGKTVVITRYVDAAKSKVDSTKSVTGKWRYTYTNAPDRYEFGFRETKNTFDMSNRYLLNYVSGNLSYPNAYVVPNTTTVHRDGRKSEYNWTGDGYYTTYTTSSGVRIKVTGTLGLSNNVIPKSSKKVGTTIVYSNPLDWKGREITGKDQPNEGAPSKSIAIPMSNRYMSVPMTTITTAGIGMFSTSNPVWTGGVKTYYDTKNVLIPLSEVLSMAGMTEEELTEELASYLICTPKDPSKFIVNTSSEIIQNGNSYTGITYYNGVNTKTSPPSGKTTSYEKSYPGHVVRWIFEADGITGARGGFQIAQFKSSEDNTIKVEYGPKYGYNATTKTFTYDRPGRLVFEYEEGSMMTATGKNWSDRIYKELIPPSSHKPV